MGRRCAEPEANVPSSLLLADNQNTTHICAQSARAVATALCQHIKRVVFLFFFFYMALVDINVTVDTSWKGIANVFLYYFNSSTTPYRGTTKIMTVKILFVFRSCYIVVR